MKWMDACVRACVQCIFSASFRLLSRWIWVCVIDDDKESESFWCWFNLFSKSTNKKKNNVRHGHHVCILFLWFSITTHTHLLFLYLFISQSEYLINIRTHKNIIRFIRNTYCGTGSDRTIIKYNTYNRKLFITISLIQSEWVERSEEEKQKKTQEKREKCIW